MPDTPISSRSDGLSDDALSKATGKPWVEWFEQARSLRMPGQRADGSFEVSASKTYPLEQGPALDVVIEAVSAGVGAPPTIESRDAKFITARWKLTRREFILATANPTRAGKTSVSLTHQRLEDAADVAPDKAAMKAWLVAASGSPGAGRRLG